MSDAICEFRDKLKAAIIILRSKYDDDATLLLELRQAFMSPGLPELVEDYIKSNELDGAAKDEITRENVDTAMMIVSNKIASSHEIFNKSNAQAAIHAISLFYDLLFGAAKEV